MGKAPKQHHLPGREPLRQLPPLRHNSHHAGALPWAQARKRAAQKFYAASLRRKHTRDGAQQRSFAAAIGAKQGRAFTCAQGKFHTAQHGFFAISGAYASHPQYGRPGCAALHLIGGSHQRLRTSRAKKGPPSRAVTTPTGSS